MEELLIICKLVRMAVFGTEEAVPDRVSWPDVFADSGLNGVSALCYEAVKRLPPDRQPDFNLMLRWDLSAQGIREGFHRRHKAAQELRTLLGDRGVAMLLLKGETLADNYPQPDLRESGDVDFVALSGLDPQSGFAACNALVESLGMELKALEKHSSFEYKGVHFENHTLEQTEGYNRVHRGTMALLRESLPKAVRRSDGCLELDPVTQAVFVVKHTAQHLCYSGGKIALRMLLDLALLLRRHPEIPGEWETVLRQVGLWRFSRVMLCTTDRLLGTAFRKEWGSLMQWRAKMFTYLFLTESNRPLRYFAKFAFLPLRPSEVLRIWCDKAGGLLWNNRY